MSEKKRLVLVSGASGAVGRAYINLLSDMENTHCIAISRAGAEFDVPNVTQCKADLLDSEATANAVRGISFDGYDEIIFVHSVGRFKYEQHGLPEIDLNNDGIDDEIYATNIETFVNVIKPVMVSLIEKRKQGEQVNLGMYGLGSLSDKHSVPCWNSYSKSKNILRSLIYHTIKYYPEFVRGMMLNVSTVDTERENELRPNADKEFWLKGSEVAEASLPFILNEQVGSWRELDIYKPSPYFKKGYYENLNEIKRRWEEQMKTPEELSQELEEVFSESEAEFKYSQSNETEVSSEIKIKRELQETQLEETFEYPFFKFK
jgi:NADP-dependent 3-hydroxy acid dehydrogenase YdfG